MSATVPPPAPVSASATVSAAELQRRNVALAEALWAAGISMRVGDDPAYVCSSVVLGAGSFGAVTAAHRYDGSGAPQPVALKRVSLRRETRFSAWLRRVKLVGREVALCNRAARSPWVVPMYHPWFDCATGAVVLPQAAGDVSLQRYAVDRGFRFPPRELVSLCLQCTHAVVGVHRCGVVHRDVKPDNFVVNFARNGAADAGVCGGAPPPLVRMVDFGLACAVEDPVEELARCVGTPLYTAPEVFPHLCDCRVPTARDVWSLGVALFHLATGGFPMFVVVDGVLQGAPRMPTRTPCGEPLSAESVAVLSVVASVLVPDPLLRPTAESVLRQLRCVAATLRRQSRGAARPRCLRPARCDTPR
ncbi:kinase-like protein [Novymonas esmeraldas]|uniref:non-specific serine/threonine protein kinase n=1 Tax=Novymonas esmeraldas TaxID=1808958 RepID=A0AAW0EZB0_9TRYP